MHKTGQRNVNSNRFGKAPPIPPPPPPTPTPAVVIFEDTPSFKESCRIGNELSLSWSKVLHVMIPGTLVYSPFFVRSLVTFGCLGARENTAEEISKAVKIPAPTDELIFESFCSTQRNVESYFKKFHRQEFNCHFVETRSFWIKRGFEILAPFSEAFAAEFPNCSFHECEFCEPESAAARINSSFSKEMNDQILNVVKPRELNEFTRIMLLHGIYFCGNWKSPFLIHNTKIANFKITSKNSVQVPMMNRSGKFLYGDFPLIDAHAVAIPYHGESLYLVFILPKSGTNLDKLRMRAFPNPILKVMKERPLSISIPRFTVQTRLHLVPLLRHIGIKSMFDPTTADFSGITGYIPGGSGLFVSDVIQVVKIEVKEGSTVPPPPPSPVPPEQSGQGSKRSNVARREVKSPRDNRSVSPRNNAKGFIVDHPFIFQVIDKKTNTLLIDGTCIDPTLVPVFCEGQANKREQPKTYRERNNFKNC